MTPNSSWAKRSRFTPRPAHGTAFSCQILSRTDSAATLKISGKGSKELFQNETGGHRWQRVPPTEKGGRVHSSTVTVAVLSAPTALSAEIPDSDIEFQYTRGSGPGGQKRNKTETCVIATHVPTGQRVRCDDECSQSTNKERAVKILRARLQKIAENNQLSQRNIKRKEQIGQGQRSDKVRTVQVQNGKVIQHSTGKTITFANYLKGRLELLK